ncbi:MAG: hypothetical protein MJZ15_02220 [Bacteroidales bacterium]|nr:hypothetical protein [Bacteroidales bacterium]
MKSTLYLSLFLCLVVFVSCGRQAFSSSRHNSWSPKADTLVILSYNVENFFHPDDDPEKNDEDFTPNGRYLWTKDRMADKAEKIKKVIMASNGGRIGSQPAIVGLCEIEGKPAVDYLLAATGLSNIYSGIVFPTPDMRGIAVAMLYDHTRVDVLESRAIGVSIADSSFFTRDVLYSKVRFSGDVYHVMVNHWPSKYGGATETIWKREHVASRVRAVCDSINASEDGKAKIVLIGDFNDMSDAPALATILGATTEGNPYVNLSDDTSDYSYKYKGEWGTIDHVIVSPVLCANGRPEFRVCKFGFISIADNMDGDVKPNRTYVGNRYVGGYSDHYPVMVRIVSRK